MKILEYPNPILRQVAKEIPFVTLAHIHQANQMMKIMKENNGIGLAAQQVGLLERIIVIDTLGVYGFKGAMFNPKILNTGGSKMPFVEGCLSFPKISQMTCRPSIISVVYTDETNAIRERLFVETTAICIQHEIDHLNGILFIDNNKEKK